MSSSSGPPKGCLYLFFGAWTLFSLVIFCFAFVVPAYRIQVAKSWDEVSCTIESVELIEDRDSEGVVYDLAVRYTYEVDGETHVSERFKLSKNRSGNRGFLEGWMGEHPPGSTAVCFVNPDDPGEAVLVRGWTNEWIFGAVSVLFVLIGLGGLRSVGWFLRKAAEAEEQGGIERGGGEDQSGVSFSPSTEAMRDGATGPIELVSGRRPVARAVLFGVFAVFWNSITWLFMFVAVLPGDLPAPWSWMIYLFVAIGAGLAVAFVHALLSLFAPTLSVTLDEAHLEPGERVDLEWRVHGNSGSVRKLTFRLEQRELKAGYEDSIRSKTCRGEVLHETDGRSRIERGHAEVTLPSDLTPSREDPDRAERWVLVVRGDIPLRPDLREDFVIWIHAPSADS